MWRPYALRLSELTPHDKRDCLFQALRFEFFEVVESVRLVHPKFFLCPNAIVALDEWGNRWVLMMSSGFLRDKIVDVLIKQRFEKTIIHRPFVEKRPALGSAGHAPY